MIDALLSRLEGVRRTGEGRYLAKCPAHDDRAPSLSIRITDDDRILLHDFAGCTVQEILGACGLTFSDLYPRREIQHGKPERKPFPAADILAALAGESLLVAVAATNLRRGMTLSEADHGRLLLAAGRIQAAREISLGRR